MPHTELALTRPRASRMAGILPFVVLSVLIGILLIVGVSANARFGTATNLLNVGSSRVDLQACKLEYSIVSPK